MQATITVILLAAAGWATAALYFDIPVPWLRLPVACLYGGAMLLGLFWPGRQGGRGIVAAGVLLVLVWWFSLRPSNTRQWLADVAETAWAEIDGDRVVVHNVRHCDYRTETDYTVRWETRSFELTEVRGIDLFLTYWGSPYIAHPILSFQFADGGHLALSIEVRKEVGEEYSAVRGFFRQFELIIVASDERDVVRLRTNYRQGEDVYLFRTTVTPEQARAVLANYLDSLNRLNARPEWYNALTRNCTTDLRAQTRGVAGGGMMPWDWRLVVSGLGDRMAYERGLLAGGLPFEDLKRRAHINPAARAADVEEFSVRVREGRPGF